LLLSFGHLAYHTPSSCNCGRYLLEALHKRLQKEDCQANGWLLDGFPHTAEQAAALEQMGIQPDKVRAHALFFMCVSAWCKDSNLHAAHR
jgi:adenylate kinase family enzyme